MPSSNRERPRDGSAIRTGRTVLLHDAAIDARFAPWKDAVTRYGLASAVSLPLRAGSRVIDALTIYDDSRNAFGHDKIEVLEELAENLSFGLDNLRSR